MIPRPGLCYRRSSRARMPPKMNSLLRRWSPEAQAFRFTFWQNRKAPPGRPPRRPAVLLSGASSSASSISWMVEDLAKIAIRRRKSYDRLVSSTATLRLSGYDISSRDNAALAVASSTALGAFQELRDRGLIDDAELLEIAYRFASEDIDIEGMLKRGKEAGEYIRPGRDSYHPPRPAQTGRVGA